MTGSGITAGRCPQTYLWALALKQGYEESRWPWRDTKGLEELRNRNKEIAARERMLRARTRPVPLPPG